MQPEGRIDIARLPVEAESVIERWNPDGMNKLRPARDADPRTQAIAVVGLGRVGKRTLSTELQAVIPGLQIAATPSEAAIALVVLDAGAVIGTDALRAIDEVVLSGARMMFVLNKIDAHREWRTVRERDVRVLGAHAGRLAAIPVYPVSARLASVARSRPQSDATDIIWASSGILLLRDALESELARDPFSSRSEQLEWATRGIADETRKRILAKAESIRQGDEAAAMRDERARLIAKRDGGRAEAMAALRSRVQLARVDLLHEVGNRIRVANVSARNEIDRSTRTDLPQFPGRLQQLTAEATDSVDASTRARLVELREQVAPSRPGAPEGVDLAPAGPRPEIAEGPEPRHRGIEDRIMIVFGASAGVGLGRLAVAPLSMVHAMEMAVLPVTLILGGLAAWWLTRSRAQMAERAHMRQWAAETLVTMKSQLEQRVHAAIVDTESYLAERVVRASASRMVEVDRKIAQVDGDLRQLASRRSGQLTSCERDLEAIDRGLSELDRARA